MTVSIIVPIFKVEKYMDRCVESLVNQTYEDLEIILVDDGSPDLCPQKCDEWTRKDARIKTVHKQNGGLGSARNAGLEVAVGQWISFVDSDDYLALNTYETCVKKLEEEHAEVCYFGAFNVDRNGSCKACRFDFPEAMEGDGIKTELLPKCFGRFKDDRYKIGSACMGIYSRALIERSGIRFVSERVLISEDYIFTAEICNAANRIAFVNDNFYFYCANEGSLTHSFRQDRFEKISYFYRNRMEYIETHNLGPEAKIRAGTRYWEAIIGGLKQEARCEEISLREKLKRIDRKSVV